MTANEARETLALLRSGQYNFERPAPDILREFGELLLYLEMQTDVTRNRPAIEKPRGGA